MNRRRFLYYSTAILLTIPLFRFDQEFLNDDPIINPQLSNFLDQEQIHLIGIAYITQNPLENTRKILSNLIIEGCSQGLNFSKGKLSKNSISNKIKADFNNGSTTLCNGWVLSITEARQCALLSLN